MLQIDASNLDFLSIPYATKQRNMHHSYISHNVTNALRMATERLTASGRRSVAIAVKITIKQMNVGAQNTLAVDARVVIKLGLSNVQNGLRRGKG